MEQPQIRICFLPAGCRSRRQASSVICTGCGVCAWKSLQTRRGEGVRNATFVGSEGGRGRVRVC